ncbi:MAG: hypothetical protein K5864_01075 [Bacteroidales bacterium]|nr:hypothetical protein [Bacteroidales bacterium]
MKQSCPKCKTIIEINEKEYEPGSIVEKQCPLCDNKVSFAIPSRKEEESKENAALRKELEALKEQMNQVIAGQAGKGAAGGATQTAGNATQEGQIRQSGQRVQTEQNGERINTTSRQRPVAAGSNERKPVTPIPIKKKSHKGLIIGLVAGSLVFLAVILIALFALFGSHNNDNDTTATEYIAEEETMYTEAMTRHDEFSVGSGKKVHFAPGNLQYNPSDQKWRFAPHQYDYIGAGNENISYSYNGWLDQFAWGTGNIPANFAVVNSEFISFNDWGDYCNLGNWRTPSMSEWLYLFTGRHNASQLYAYATVCGVQGVVVLPDDFEQPSGVSYTAGRSYGSNYYDSRDWEMMERAGAIFLPTSGKRNGYTVDKYGTDGDYWSSTPKGDDRAYNLDFDGTQLTANDDSQRHYGFAVRLVLDVY